jgi:hypothetical protein
VAGGRNLEEGDIAFFLNAGEFLSELHYVISHKIVSSIVTDLRTLNPAPVWRQGRISPP